MASWKVAIILLLPTPMVDAGSAEVTLNFDGLPLARALQALSDQTGRNFVSDPDIGNAAGPDVQLRAVPASIAVRMFAVAYQVCLEPQGEIIKIVPCKV